MACGVCMGGKHESIPKLVFVVGSLQLCMICMYDRRLVRKRGEMPLNLDRA